nr:ribonuclease H-like domain-containing protein [Tanacetum cinerariifolium]
VDASADAQLFIGTGMSDDGMNQADSGVAAVFEELGAVNPKALGDHEVLDGPAGGGGVILNGNSTVPTRVVEGILQPVAPTTAEQRLARKNEPKARGTLLMALPDKHQLKFNSHKDAKTLMEAIKKRFEGNTETKKVQKTLLKQQFENFTGSSSKSLDQIHDKLQKLTHTIIWRNKADLEEQSLDDLFNSLKIYVTEVKQLSSTSTASQNLAFVSSSHTDSTTDSVSAAASVSAACAKLPASSLPNVDSLSNAMAMLTMRARRFLQKTGRNLGANGPISMGIDIYKVECYNCHRKGHFARECRSSKDPRRPGTAEPQRRTVPVETSTSNALVSQCDGACAKLPASSLPNVDSLSNAVIYSFFASQSTSPQLDNEDLKQIDFDDLEEMDLRWKVHFARECRSSKDPSRPEEEPVNFDLMAFSSSSSDNETGLESVEARLLVYKQNEYVFEENIKLLNIEVQLRDTALANLRHKLDKAEKDSDDLKLKFQPSGGYHAVPPLYTGTFMPPKPDLVFNTAPTTKIKTTIPAATHVLASPKSNNSGQRRNRKACFVCKSVDHLIKNYDFHTKKMAQPTQKNYAHRCHHKQYAPLTYSKPQKHMVPTAVLTQSKPVSNTAVRPVSAALPNITVTRPRHAHHVVTKFKSPIRRHITRSPSSKTSNSPPRVTAVQALVVSAARGNPKGGKITGKVKIKTGKFQGKVDEGFLVGYSVCSKAFRVFNSRAGTIQETLHVHFLENKPNVAGSGPTWLLDIDSLTKTMHYQPINAGNQTNSGAGFQDKFDAEKAGEKVDQSYMLFPVWSAGSTNPQNNAEDAAFDGKEHDFDVNPESEVILSPSSSAQSKEQDDKTKKEAKGKIPIVGQNSINSTNTFSAAGPSKDVVSPPYGKSSFTDASQLPDDLDMPELEDITYSVDEDVVGTEVDSNNLESYIPVSPIPTTRIHKDHPVL